MYKVKIIFTYSCFNEKGQVWKDYDGKGSLDDVIERAKEEEKQAMRDLQFDGTVTAAICEKVVDCTKGDFQCKSCKCFFRKVDMEDKSCPYCGSEKYTKKRSKPETSEISK